MDRLGGFLMSADFSEGLVAKERKFASRILYSREGSRTAQLAREGFPTITAKIMEELGETVQAFLEQEDEQVNLETSQLLYYLMVAVAVSRQGSIEKSIDQFRTLRAARIELPATLGLGFRELSESVGLAHGACMPGSFSADVNGRVADVFLKVDNLIEITGKGSWEGILAKL